MRFFFAFNNLVFLNQKLKIEIIYTERGKRIGRSIGCYKAMTSVSQYMFDHVSAETYNCLFCQVSHLLLSKFQTTYPLFQPDSFRVLRVQKYTIISI